MSTRSSAVESPWLHEEIGQRMAQRLGWIRLRPQAWLNASPWLGGLNTHAAVAAHYPDAQVWLDGPMADRALAHWQPKGLRRWLPSGPRVARWQPGGSVGLIWSNMALHAEPDAANCLADWHRRLQVDGFLMFSCLGPDSLKELRAVHAQAGWPPPHLPFVDMHDWGDRLVGAGFAEPVMDMERIVLTYSHVDALLAELRGLGRNRHPERWAGLRSRRWGQAYREQLQALLPRDADGRLTLTFEVVYGHAFKPAPRAKAGPQSTIELDTMREMLRKGRAA